AASRAESAVTVESTIGQACAKASGDETNVVQASAARRSISGVTFTSYANRRAPPALCRPRAIDEPASPKPTKPMCCIVTFWEQPADFTDKTATNIRVIREIRGYLMEVAAAVAEDHLSGDQFSVIARDERNQSCKVFGLNPLLDCLIHHDAI